MKTVLTWVSLLAPISQHWHHRLDCYGLLGSGLEHIWGFFGFHTIAAGCFIGGLFYGGRCLRWSWSLELQNRGSDFSPHTKSLLSKVNAYLVFSTSLNEFLKCEFEMILALRGLNCHPFAILFKQHGYLFSSRLPIVMKANSTALDNIPPTHIFH